jgi:hypothetical protein
MPRSNTVDYIGEVPNNLDRQVHILKIVMVKGGIFFNSYQIYSYLFSGVAVCYQQCYAPANHDVHLYSVLPNMECGFICLHTEKVCGICTRKSPFVGNGFTVAIWNCRDHFIWQLSLVSSCQLALLIKPRHAMDSLSLDMMHVHELKANVYSAFFRYDK